MAADSGLRNVAPLAVDRTGAIVLVTTDALPVGRIGAFDYFRAFDIATVMAIQAGLGNALVFPYSLVTVTARLEIDIVFRGMVMTIPAGYTIAVRRKMGFVIEQDFSRYSTVHDSKRLVRLYGGKCCVTENAHNKQNPCQCVGQLELSF